MVDPSVQRPLDSVRAAGIAGDFDPESLGVLHISQRADGKYHVIDGQHRWAAASLAKHTEPLNVILWRGLTRAQEASMFRRLNNTRAPQPLDKFRVRIVEGEPVACKLAGILRKHGWAISKASSEGCFYAVAALERVYLAKDGGDEETVDTLIRLATAAWGHNSNGMRAEIVSGMGVLLRRHPHLDFLKLSTELAKHDGGPLGLIGRARQLRDLRGGRVSDAMAEILVNEHNKRRHGVNRLPEWGAE